MAQNNERSAPSHARLEVPPQLKLSKEVKEFDEVVLITGKDLHFEATCMGWPKPTVDALFNDQLLRYHATIAEYNNVYVIKLNNITSTLNGRLTLIAKNIIGEEVKYFTIKVLDVPNPPRQFKVQNLTPHTAEFKWQASTAAEDDRTFVEFYTVERKTAKHSRWRQVAKIRCGGREDKEQPCAATLKYTTDELFADEIYIFRAFANNDIGKSAPSNSLDVITPSDADYEEDISLTLSASESNSLNLSAPQKPSILSNDNFHVELSWSDVEGAAIYAVERRIFDEDMWLEIANTDRNKFKDRSVLVTGKYVYRIIAKLPGVSRSAPSEESDVAFVMYKEAMERQNSWCSPCPSPTANRSSSIDLPQQRSLKLDSGIDETELNPLKALQKQQQKQVNFKEASSLPPQPNPVGSGASRSDIEFEKSGVESKQSEVEIEAEQSAIKANQSTVKVANASEDIETSSEFEPKTTTKKRIIRKAKKPIENESKLMEEIKLKENLPKELNVDEGDSLDICMEWTTGSVKKCVWKKSDKILNKFTLTENKSIYTILNAKQTDFGIYTCLVSNESGKQEVSLDFNVHINGNF